MIKCNNNLQIISIINEHLSSIECLILLRDSRIASCSTDNTIKIFNPISNYHCDITITIENIWCIETLCEIDKGTLLSGMDHIINIWKISQFSYKCLKTIKAHSGLILKLITLPHKQFASCSVDSTIKIWNSNAAYQCEVTIKAHSRTVFSILLTWSQELLVSASENSLGIWDINTFKCLRKVVRIECTNNNSLVQLCSDKVAVGEWYQIIIVNIILFQIETVIDDESFEYITSFLLLRNGNLLCGGMKELYEFDNREFKCVYKKTSVYNNIKCLIYLNKNTIAAGSGDKKIIIWNKQCD